MIRESFIYSIKVKIVKSAQISNLKYSGVVVVVAEHAQ